MGMIYFLQVLDNLHITSLFIALMSICFVAVNWIFETSDIGRVPGSIRYGIIVAIISTAVFILTPDNISFKYELYQKNQQQMKQTQKLVDEVNKWQHNQE